MTGSLALGIFVAFWVATGVLALVLGAWLLVRRPDVGSPPSSWGISPDDERWEAEAVDERHQALASVRAAAASWSQTIGALLGVFSIVAFVKGPEAFTAVDGPRAYVAAILVVAAAIAAAAAIVFGALAAQGIPQQVDILDGWALKWLTATRTTTAVRQLAVSRILALLAALVLVSAVGLTWITTLDQQRSGSQHALVGLGNAAPTVCGVLRSRPGGLWVEPETGPHLPVPGDASITFVDSCPPAAK